MKIIVAVLLLLAVMLPAALWAAPEDHPGAGAATQPSASQPASTDLQKSEAVRAGGLDFQIMAPAVWIVPGEGKQTAIPLALKVTNRGDKTVYLNIDGTCRVILKDANGKELQMDSGQDAVPRHREPPPPLAAPKGQSVTLDRTAHLQPFAGNNGPYRLVGSDGVGFWAYSALAPGKYTISMAYENAPAPLGKADHMVDPKVVPVWTGKVTSKELTVEIVAPAH